MSNICRMNSTTAARQSAELDNRMQNIRNLIAEEAEEEDHCTL